MLREQLTCCSLMISAFAPQPNGEWIKQIGRNLTDADEGFLNGTRYLIYDRAPLFTQEFSEILKSSSVKAVKLPARSPNLNVYAERFVRSIKSECLTQIIPLGERHLRKAVKEYTEHYQQGRGNELIEKPGDGPNMDVSPSVKKGWGVSSNTTIGGLRDDGLSFGTVRASILTFQLA